MNTIIARYVPMPAANAPRHATSIINPLHRTKKNKSGKPDRGLPLLSKRKLCYISLSGVIGKSRTLFPVALYTAFATAAAIPIKAISPMPFAPIGLI
jgi:hypothetical protein